MFARAKFAVILFALTLLLRFARWYSPQFAARLKERNLVAQIKARDEGIGRWIEIRDGKVTIGRRPASEARHHAPLQECRDRRVFADAADQLARPDQRAEGFYARRRRTGGPHQLVRADAHDDADRALDVRHADARRLDALLQHDQWRAGLHHRQGRQDRAHDADRFRRHRSAAVDDQSARPRSSRRRARRRWRRTGRTPNRSSMRRTACCIR